MAPSHRKIIFTLFLNIFISIILFLIIFAFVIGFVVFWLAPDALNGFAVSQNDTVIKSSASVYPNPFNKAAEQLKTKEAELSEKEKNLQSEKNSLIEAVDSGWQKVSTYLSAIGGVLFILILLNFYFDYRRKAPNVGGQLTKNH